MLYVMLRNVHMESIQRETRKEHDHRKTTKHRQAQTDKHVEEMPRRHTEELLETQQACFPSPSVTECTGTKLPWKR